MEIEDFTYFYDKLLSFYNVKTLKDISKVTNIPISTLSSIKQRNSITALKKKCRELNIFDEIFGDINSGVLIKQGKNSRAGGRDYIEAEIEALVWNKAKKENLTYGEIFKMLNNVSNSFANQMIRQEQENNKNE